PPVAVGHHLPDALLLDGGDVRSGARVELLAQGRAVLPVVLVGGDLVVDDDARVVLHVLFDERLVAEAGPAEDVDGQGDLIVASPTATVVTTGRDAGRDRKSTRLNSSHVKISYAVFCLKK